MMGGLGRRATSILYTPMHGLGDAVPSHTTHACLTQTNPTNQAVDAAALLVTVARKESPAPAAFLVEQAAWAYLKGGNIRKFAFYAAMAGQTYRNCGLDKVRAGGRA